MTQRKARTLYVVEEKCPDGEWCLYAMRVSHSEAQEVLSKWRDYFRKYRHVKPTLYRIVRFTEVLPLPRKRKAKR